MADANANGGSAFWADAARKTATWTGVGTLALAILEHVDDQPWNGPEWEHYVVVIGLAALRAALALVQGKVGDPAKASFKAAAKDGKRKPVGFSNGNTAAEDE